MGFIKFFSVAHPDKQELERVKTCLREITDAVSQKSGITDFIHYDAYSVAFAGSRECMELFLTIYMQKYGGKKYLYASLDDEIAWQEWDFNNETEFQADIIRHISNRVNRTIKTVTKKAKHQSYRQSVYYLNESTGEWILLEDDCTEDAPLCLIAANKTETTETIKTYKLDMR